MSSAQKSLTLYFKRKAIVEESDNNLAKKNKLNDNLNNILNDNVTTAQTISNTEPSRDTQPNINENCPLSTTANTTANDNKKRRYQKWYSDNYKWLIHESNQGGFCRICRDYWKPTIPFYSEMNARTKGAFATQPFVNWKTAPGPNGSLEEHQQSSYHKTAVQNLSYRQQEGSVIEQLLNVSELERQENRQRFGDLLDAAYFLFKHELPHTTLYSSLLELLAKTDHSKKLSSFFDKCQKNASYDSTTTVTELLQAISEIIDEQILRKIRVFFLIFFQIVSLVEEKL